MPLRDHFRPPLSEISSWEEVHGGWPMVIVQQLQKALPPPCVAGPRLHLGSVVEIDVATFESEPSDFDEYEVRIYDTRRGQQGPA